jgi:hypothetical protein
VEVTIERVPVLSCPRYPAAGRKNVVSTDAPALARAGEESEWPREAAASPWLPESLDEGCRRTHPVRRRCTRQGRLHNECFYNGLCSPLGDTKRRDPADNGLHEDAAA